MHSFTEEDGRRLSVNTESYLALLKDVVWPVFRNTATRRGYWWMQDGATPHCTLVAKNFLQEKFQNRVISRGSAINWPARSPDLNPLDFHFWGTVQAEVYRAKPQTIENLVEYVRNFADSYDAEILRNAATNVLKRARLCIQADGGHFQHLL